MLLSLIASDVIYVSKVCSLGRCFGRSHGLEHGSSKAQVCLLFELLTPDSNAIILRFSEIRAVLEDCLQDNLTDELRQEYEDILLKFCE